MEPISWQNEMLAAVHSLCDEHVGRWFELVNRLGVPDEKRMHWSTTFLAEMQNLFVEMYKDIEERETIILNSIQTLKKKIADVAYRVGINPATFTIDLKNLFQEELKLKSYLGDLEAKLQKKLEDVEVLKKRQEKICVTLGRPQKPICSNPLPNAEELDDLLTYIEKLEDECFLREEQFTAVQSEIQTLAFEVDYKPIAEFEQRILDPLCTVFEVNDKNMLLLNTFRTSLRTHVETVKTEVGIFFEKIQILWNTLEEDQQHRDTFLKVNVGYKTKTLLALKYEIKRLEEIKKDNVEILIKRLRLQLLALWDKCRFSESQRNEFICFNDDVYTESMLNLFQNEVLRVRKHHEDNKSFYEALMKYEEAWQRMAELDAPRTGGNRLKNRGGALLLEEKERKLTKKRIEKLVPHIQQLAQAYLKLYKTDFIFGGLNPDEFMKQFHDVREEQKQAKITSASTSKATLCGAKSSNLLTSRSLVKVPKPLHAYNSHNPAKKSSLKLKEVAKSAPSKIRIGSGRIQSGSRKINKKETIVDLKGKTKLLMDTLRVDGTLHNYSQFEALIDTTMPSLVNHTRNILGSNRNKRSSSDTYIVESPLAIPLLETPAVTPSKDNEQASGSANNNNKLALTPACPSANITMRRMFRNFDTDRE